MRITVVIPPKHKPGDTFDVAIRTPTGQVRRCVKVTVPPGYHEGQKLPIEVDLLPPSPEMLKALAAAGEGYV